MYDIYYLEKKRLKEKSVMFSMIKVFCKSKHKTKNFLCNECRNVLSYAYEKIEICPYMKNKTFCSSCKTHCYNKDMQEKIKQIMRFSGPKMIFYHPITALKYVFIIIRKKFSN